MTLQYKGVIFDFNGTLFFDNDKHVEAWGRISKLIRGKEITEEELHTHCNGVPNAKIIEYFFGGEATNAQIEKYSYLKEEIYRLLCQEDQENFHLVKGAEKYFDELKKHHIPFTIASASIRENIDFFVDSFHLNYWISPDTIIYDDGTYQNKIAMFLDAASMIHVPIQDCLIIEDSISGIKNAYDAGCRQIVVIDSANKKEVYEKLPGVKAVITDFTLLC